VAKARAKRKAKKRWLQWLVFGATFFVLTAGYLLLLRLAFTTWGIDESATGTRRDNLFLIIHGAFLVGAPIAGFVAARWLNGLGVAFAVLFFSLMVVAELGTIAASQALACNGGRNDLIRHWNC
jgi:hypothetical protein